MLGQSSVARSLDAWLPRRSLRCTFPPCSLALTLGKLALAALIRLLDAALLMLAQFGSLDVWIFCPFAARFCLDVLACFHARCAARACLCTHVVRARMRTHFKAIWLFDCSPAGSNAPALLAPEFLAAPVSSATPVVRVSLCLACKQGSPIFFSLDSGCDPVDFICPVTGAALTSASALFLHRRFHLRWSQQHFHRWELQ
jgi:hypothetical protein